MTRLVCFYTELDPRVREALERFGPMSGLAVDWVETSGDGQAYAEALARYWTGNDDLILVEQDKEIYPVTLPDLLGCDQPWCACTYWIYPEPHTTLCIGGFGCTRFSAEIQQQIAVADFAGDGWLGIDRRFLEILKRRGIGCCLHEMVTHHHVYEPRPTKVRDHVARLRSNKFLPPAMAPASSSPSLLPGSNRLPGR